MESLSYIAGVGTASECAVVKDHRPRPQRFVWHHVMPKTCGGQTVPANLVSLCDSCHYAVHALLHSLALGHPLPPHESPGRRRIAQDGYDAAAAAGTVDKIPNEGGGE